MAPFIAKLHNLPPSPLAESNRVACEDNGDHYEIIVKMGWCHTHQLQVKPSEDCLKQVLKGVLMESWQVMLNLSPKCPVQIL